MKCRVSAHSVFTGLERTIKRKFHVFYYAFHESKVMRIPVIVNTIPESS